MIEKLTNWALGLFVACLFALAMIGAFGQCSKPVPPSNGQRIDTIVQVRHDTLVKIDSVLKYKIKRIEVAPDTEIVKQFDTLFRDTGHSDTVKTTVYAERECLKCVDSLQACKKIVEVDSNAIDSLVKIGKKEASPTLIDDAKKVGLGVLIGITIKSFF